MSSKIDIEVVTKPIADDPAVTNALRALMALDAAQLATLAAKLATEDGALLDRLADMLLSEMGMDAPPVMPSEAFMRQLVAIADGGKGYTYEEFDDDDYYNLPAVAQ